MEYDFKKQVTIFNPLIDEQPNIHVIGAGALGSWLTLMLCKLGFSNVTVWDGDKVEKHNLPNQLYTENQIGMYKVIALREILRTAYPSIISSYQFIPSMIVRQNVTKLDGVVFNCVDSMQARKLIYKLAYLRGDVQFMVEDRLSIHGCYIYTLDKKSEDWTEEYEKTLYDDAEAEVSECGVSQTVVTSAFFTSSLMVDTLLQWLKGERYLKRNEVEMHGLYAMTEWNNYI